MKTGFYPKWECWTGSESRKGREHEEQRQITSVIPFRFCNGLEPCLVRSDGEVIDGHLRLKAARKLGLTEIPVILCDEWTRPRSKPSGSW
jgi:hypothetical protein